MLCYSLVFDSLGKHLERRRLLPKIPLELVLELRDLRETGVLEVAQPLIEEGAEVTAVKVAGPLSAAEEEDFERLAVLADELGAPYMVVPVGAADSGKLATQLAGLFRVAAVYAKKVALEPSRSVLPELDGRLSSFLGGVFKYAVSPEPGCTTEDFLELALSHFGQLTLVKLVSFASGGGAARVTSAEGLNVFAVVGELIERGYDGLFVLSYEPHGLFLPSHAVREDVELLLHYARSVAGRVA